MTVAHEHAIHAIAAIASISEERASGHIQNSGREPGEVPTKDQVMNAAGLAGYDSKELQQSDIIAQFPKSHQTLKNVTTNHPKRFPKAWDAEKLYFIFTNDDKKVYAVVNGELVNGEGAKAERASSVYELSPR